MAEPRVDRHVLVLYRSGDRANGALRSIRKRAARITVVVLARQEPERSGCCDTRSTLWNRICRDLAHEDLSMAVQAFDGREGVAFRVLLARDSEVVEAIAREAVERGADEIVLADPRGSGLGRLERRRLSQCSAVPVCA